MMLEKQKLIDLGFKESNSTDDLFFKKKNNVVMFVDQREGDYPKMWGVFDTGQGFGGFGAKTDSYTDWNEYQKIKEMAEEQEDRSNDDVDGENYIHDVMIKTLSGDKYYTDSFEWEYHCAVFIRKRSDGREHRYEVPRENIDYIEYLGGGDSDD